MCSLCTNDKQIIDFVNRNYMSVLEELLCNLARITTMPVDFTLNTSCGSIDIHIKGINKDEFITIENVNN